MADVRFSPLQTNVKYSAAGQRYGLGATPASTFPWLTAGAAVAALGSIAYAVHIKHWWPACVGTVVVGVAPLFDPAIQHA